LLAFPPTVVLDPGHGTKNCLEGTKDEAYYTLLISKQIRMVLEKHNIRAILTHSYIGEDLGAKNADDDNRLRAKIANRNKALLFLRIHFDCPSGASAIYYPRLHPNKEVASKSREAASYIWSNLKPVLPNVKKKGILGDEKTKIGSQKGGLLVGSKFSKVPVVLVEILPLKKEMKDWLNRKKNRENVSEAIAKGVLEYIRHCSERSKHAFFLGTFGNLQFF
jgi:N-acetylmuramoyl-L-alanine amidase